VRFLVQQTRESLDAAQRGAKIVSDRIAKAFEFTVDCLEISSSFCDPLFEGGIGLSELLLQLQSLCHVPDH
jgi:hypothetical protein